MEDTEIDITIRKSFTSYNQFAIGIEKLVELGYEIRNAQEKGE